LHQLDGVQDRRAIHPLESSGVRVKGSGLRVQGSGLRVKG